MMKYSKVIAMFALGVNLFLAGLHRGYNIPLPKFEFSGPVFADTYLYICFFLLLFLIGKSVKHKLISTGICFSTVLLIIFQYKFIYLYKTKLTDEGEPIKSLFQYSIPLDLIGFVLIITLLLIEVIKSAEYLREQRGETLNT